MSNVPPSPAQTMTVVSDSPRTSSAARMPEAVAAPVSKAVWYSGTLSDDCGQGPAITDQQLAGMTTMGLGPRAFIARGAAQPGQARCPDVISSCSGTRPARRIWVIG